VEVLNQSGGILIALAVVAGLFMCWGIGANDVANAMGTSVGARALTVRKALVVAAVFEFTGAFLAGGHVSSTIKDGIVDPAGLAGRPDLLAFGMLSSLMAAGTWLLIASWRGWPVSTTHSIVGALAGFALVGIGPQAVQWNTMGKIVGSWVVSPLVGGVFAFLLMTSIRKLVLDRETPFASAKRYAPVYLFIVGFTITAVTVFKGLKNVGLELSVPASFGVATAMGLLVAVGGWWRIQKVQVDAAADRDFHFASVEKVFTPMMVVTACCMAFAHGSNDVANGIGPVAGVLQLVSSGGNMAAKAPVPNWVLLLGGAGIVVGLATYGYKVMATIGHKITELTPTRGFSAELAAATTVVLASRTGMPISTTHVAVGAVIGVGLARGIGAIDLRVIGGIVVSWLVTVPIGGLLSAGFFFALQAVFL
jgi:inorganic phosphate transporter, PiT family